MPPRCMRSCSLRDKAGGVILVGMMLDRPVGCKCITEPRQGHVSAPVSRVPSLYRSFAS